MYNVLQVMWQDIETIGQYLLECEQQHFVARNTSLTSVTLHKVTQSTVNAVGDLRRDRTRASVKLFELGVRMPGGVYFCAYGTPRVLIFGVFVCQPSDFRRNFRPTRIDEDV